MSSCPKLRIEGFTDAWEQREVKDLCSISTGKSNTQDKVEGGEYPFYVRSPIVERSTKYLYDEEAVITVGDGVGTGKVFHYVNGKYDLHQRCYRMFGFNEELNPKYFYHVFSKMFYKRVMSMTAKTSVDSVRMDMIANMEIPVPNVKEQEKIGAFLTGIDNLITLHQRKSDALKNAKKYFLKNMFPSEGEKFPKLRLEGFTDAWEQRKVSDITKFHKQGFYTTEAYDNNKKYYLLRGTDLTENKLILKDTPKINATERDYQAFRVEIGDFLIVRSGTVGTYGIVYDDIPAIFGSYLIDFRFDTKQVVNEFFGYFYQSDLFKKQLSQIVQRSANTNINAENIKSTSIMLPTLDEQKRISGYLSKLDNLITLHQRKCDALKNAKKFFLQNMFV